MGIMGLINKVLSYLGEHKRDRMKDYFCFAFCLLRFMYSRLYALYCSRFSFCHSIARCLSFWALSVVYLGLGGGELKTTANSISSRLTGCRSPDSHMSHVLKHTPARAAACVLLTVWCTVLDFIEYRKVVRSYILCYLHRNTIELRDLYGILTVSNKLDNLSKGIMMTYLWE